MKRLVGLHLAILAGTAAVLTVLFSLSQIDDARHSRDISTLLGLQKLSGAFDKTIVELQAGQLYSYEPLTKITLTTQQRLNALHAITMDGYPDETEDLNRLISEFTTDLANTLEVTEQFKQHHSIVRLSEQYFPPQARTIADRFANDPALSLVEYQLYAGRLKDFVIELLYFLNNQSESIDKTRSLMQALKQDMNTLPSYLWDDINLLLRYASKIISTRAQSNKLANELLARREISLLIRIFNNYSLYQEKQEQTAERYKMWMYGTALFLLLYLAYIYLRLIRTGRDLRKTLQQLRFQKFSLDEHAIVSITDNKGNITYANDKFCEISQYTREELLGKNHRIVKSDEHSTRYCREMWRTIARGNVWHGVFCNQAKDGSRYWVESTIVPRLDSKGKPVEYIGIRTEITRQVTAEQEVKALAMIPEENPEPVLRVDASGLILYANPASESLLKAWSTTMQGNLPEMWATTNLRVLTDNTMEEHEMSVAGETYLIKFTPVPESGYVNIYGRNVTIRKKAETELSYQATHDRLTDISNRFVFEDALQRKLEELRGSDDMAVLVYIDLDQFKLVNDTSGHIAGDELLRQLARKLAEGVRDQDLLARLGGDEFGLLLSDCNIEQGQRVVDNLQHIIQEFRFVWENKSFDIGASMGMVLIDRNSASMVDLMGAADMACYMAKDAGRNHVHVYYPDDENTARRQSEMHWASEIPQILAQNNLVLMAQTVKPLQPGDESVHYEILVRIKDKDGGLIPPGAFIPAAERYNLMSAIDHWVIDNVIDHIASTRAIGHNARNMMFAINLSGQSLTRKTLLTFIGDKIRSSHIPAGMLCFEVTETAAIRNLSAAINFIHELKMLGCRFALDDFGSGLSSFTYLKNLPVDYLKIDGTFVSDILQDPIDEAMVSSINQIGHVMGIKTIAEFAESREIIEHLRKMGVDYAQGYGIDHPRPLLTVFPGKDNSIGKTAS